MPDQPPKVVALDLGAFTADLDLKRPSAPHVWQACDNDHAPWWAVQLPQSITHPFVRVLTGDCCASTFGRSVDVHIGSESGPGAAAKCATLTVGDGSAVGAHCQGEGDWVTIAAHAAFCLVRPPGHHAMVDGWDKVAGGNGFCFLNNVGIGAAHAIAAHGKRVAIVDFDVQHGNGTEELFAHDPSVLVASVHVHDSSAISPFYPASSGGFAPAAAALGPLVAPAARRAVALADRVCGGRLVSVLEGGYQPQVLRRCVRAHVLALAGERA